MVEEPKKLRGFALLSKERMREIASMGGKAVKPEQRSFFTNRSLAATSGRIGGQRCPNEKRTFARLGSEYASEQGKKGGAAVPNSCRTFSKDPEAARKAGALGAAARAAKLSEPQA